MLPVRRDRTHQGGEEVIEKTVRKHLRNLRSLAKDLKSEFNVLCTENNSEELRIRCVISQDYLTHLFVLVASLVPEK